MADASMDDVGSSGQGNGLKGQAAGTISQRKSTSEWKLDTSLDTIQKQENHRQPLRRTPHYQYGSQRGNDNMRIEDGIDGGLSSGSYLSMPNRTFRQHNGGVKYNSRGGSYNYHRGNNNNNSGYTSSPYGGSNRDHRSGRYNNGVTSNYNYGHKRTTYDTGRRDRHSGYYGGSCASPMNYDNRYGRSPNGQYYAPSRDYNHNRYYHPSTNASAMGGGMGYDVGPPRRRKLKATDLLSVGEMALMRAEIIDEDKTYGVKFKDTVVCKVDKITGELKLNSGGWRTMSTLGVINACIRPFNMVVSEDDGIESDHGVLGGTWTVRYLAQGRGKAESAVLGRTFDDSVTVDMQRFEDDLAVSIGSDLHPHLITGRSSVLKQYLSQQRLTLEARLKLGNRPPELATLPRDIFIQKNTVETN